jgi:hypothetical protein
VMPNYLLENLAKSHLVQIIIGFRVLTWQG